MSDRFKFRAWNREEKKWINPVRVDLHEGYPSMSFHIEGGGFTANYAGVILMQSTGLKDKNGKLIFEGDVIAHDRDRAVYVIEWRQGCCGFVAQIPAGQRFDHFIAHGDWERLEIVGNIHEHPELIGKV